MASAPDSDDNTSSGYSDSEMAVDTPLTDASALPSVPDLKHEEPLVALKHTSLHTVFTGVRHPASIDIDDGGAGAEVRQFRGIKYAAVPMRFRRSVLHETYELRTDATRFGPICPQIKNKWLATRLYGLPEDMIPKPTYVPPADEFECCNLTITTPSYPHGRPNAHAQPNLPQTPHNKLLPVMVWIHGGGNVTGSGTEWIWDMGMLVRKSVEVGKPVVAVALNFRLGLFGFGASELLREDNASAGEEGVGNYGLLDQRTALMWIRKYISGFGGDPQNITLFGSSWGAADIHAHLLSAANHDDVTAETDSEGPLFHRAILQSGALVPSSSVVQDVGTAGHHLWRITSALKISTVEELRAIPAATIVKLTGERVRPVDDGVFLRKDWRTLALPFSNGEKARWRQDVIIGDVACESVLWATPARLWAADAVARRARAIVQSVRRADALMRAYDIVDADKGNSGANSPTRETPRISAASLAAAFSGIGGASSSGSALADEEEDETSSNSSGSGSDDGVEELAERVMELMNDVAFAWPVDVAARCAADSAFVFEEPKGSQSRRTSQSRGMTTVNGLLSASNAVAELSGSESDSSAMTSSESDAALANQQEHARKNHEQESENERGRRAGGRPPNAPYVYRYVFDQASPYTGQPHHGVDLLYLFANIPFPRDPELTEEENDEVNWDRVKVRAEMQERWLAFACGEEPWDALTPQPPAGVANMSDKGIFATPMLSPVSSLFVRPHHSRTQGGNLSPVSSRSSSFSQVPSAVGGDHSSRASSFSQHLAANPFFTSSNHSHSHHTQHHQHQHAHAHHNHNGAQPYGPGHPPPISISESDKVFVFGPEGETGTRSAKIFAGRRRVHAWREALAPLGLATAQKVGLELGNGPPEHGQPRF